MGALLDVLFAAIVAAAVMLNISRVNDDLLVTQHRHTMQYVLQRNSEALQRLLLRDLRMAGAGAGVVAGAGVAGVDSTTITLYGNLLRDGAQHAIRYRLGDPSEATGTANPRDRLLWRTVDDGTPRAYALGLTDLRLVYLDEDGLATADSTRIRSVHCEYILESPAPYGNDSPALYVSAAVAPKNLR